MTDHTDTAAQAVCPECKFERPQRDEPPFVTSIEMPGMPHHDWCPTIPRLDDAAKAKLRADLDRIDQARAEAMRDSHNYIIRGVSRG